MKTKEPTGKRALKAQWKEFLAFKQAIKENPGINAEELAKRFDKFHGDGKPNRAYCQVRLNLARMPKFIQEEVERYCNGEESPLTWGHIASLYKVYNLEFLNHPNGDGPELTAAWKALMGETRRDPPAARHSDAVYRVKVYRPKSILPQTIEQFDKVGEKLAASSLAALKKWAKDYKNKTGCDVEILT